MQGLLTSRVKQDCEATLSHVSTCVVFCFAAEMILGYTLDTTSLCKVQVKPLFPPHIVMRRTRCLIVIPLLGCMLLAEKQLEFLAWNFFMEACPF